MSCFVCERKHRHVKDSALHVFRHLEHTVLHDVVNTQCQQLLEGVELFKEQFLVTPRDVRDVPNLRRSTRAVLKLGGLYGHGVYAKVEMRPRPRPSVGAAVVVSECARGT